MMQGDPEGNSLMEEVLNACFDYSLLSMETRTGRVDEGRDDRLLKLRSVLERFNDYLSGRFAVCGEGLFLGTDSEVASWSEDLTFQILSNRPN
jgi:hypothetical protein